MKIGIIGRGNVGAHLYKALDGKVKCDLIDSRTLREVDGSHQIYLISVKDDAIRNVVENISKILPHFNGVVAHTSGSVGIDVFEPMFQNYGSLYPLQTFTKDKVLEYDSIPVFIEGNNPETESKLTELAAHLSHDIHIADSEKRKALHIAAVFACNFTNFLYGEASEILERVGFDFRILKPLVRETLEKLDGLSAAEAQTGPALRGDFKVIEAHKKHLDYKPATRELYDLLSESIYRKARNE